MKHALQGLLERVVAAEPAARDDEPECSGAAWLARVSDPPHISELRSHREPAQPPGLSGDGPAAKGLMAPTNAPSEGELGWEGWDRGSSTPDLKDHFRPGVPAEERD